MSDCLISWRSRSAEASLILRLEISDMRSSLCGSSDDDLPSSSCDRQRKHGGQHATQTQHRSTRDANTAAVNTRRKHSGGQHATQTQQRSTHDANTAAVNPRRKYGGQHTTQTQRSTPGVGSLRRVVPGITVMPLGFTVVLPGITVQPFSALTCPHNTDK